MKLSHIYDHNCGRSHWERRELYEWLTDIFEAPSLRIQPGCTTEIRQHVRDELEKGGWAINVRLTQESDLSVFAIHDDMAFHIQTGNMSRAPYDLLKLQYLYQTRRIEGCALAVPVKAAAEKIGSNIANAERIANELELFNRIITVPIMLIAFE